MSKGTQSRIVELDATAQNASEQLGKATIKISIVDSRLKHLLEKLEIESSAEVFIDNQMIKLEITELEKQRVALNKQSIIFSREKLDAEVRKKNILRNQSKVHGKKDKLQAETKQVESKLKSLVISQVCDGKDEVEENLENHLKQQQKSDPGNNNLNIVDDQNNKEKSSFILDIINKEADDGHDISASLPNKERISFAPKSDGDNNSSSLMVSSHVSDNGATQDCSKSFHSIASVISAEDEEFVPVQLPPKEEWQNPLVWRQQPSFSNKQFTAIKTSPPIDWNGRYKDLSSSSRSRSQSEDRSNPMGVARGPQDLAANCRVRQSRSRVKRVQEMKDLHITRDGFNVEGGEEIYKHDLAIKTKDADKPHGENGRFQDKDPKWKILTRSNKNSPSANLRLCKKYDNNNISDSEMKPNAAMKPDKITDMRTAAEMRNKMKEPFLFKPKSDKPSFPMPDSTEHECICLRPLKMILCVCSNWFVGRVRTICPVHPQDLYLLDVDSCKKCNHPFLKEYDMDERDGEKLYRNSLMTNKYTQNEAIKTEPNPPCLKGSQSLLCSICCELCKRGVSMPCCDAKACRYCAVKNLTDYVANVERKCWNCSQASVATKDLVVDESLREAIREFINTETQGKVV